MYKLIWNVQINQFINPKSICTLKWSYSQIIWDFGGMYILAIVYNPVSSVTLGKFFILICFFFLFCLLRTLTNVLLCCFLVDNGQGLGIEAGWGLGVGFGVFYI